MAVKDHCPFCKSKNIVFLEPAESKIQMQKLLEQNKDIKGTPEIDQIMSMLKENSQTITDEEMDFYEKHGRNVICKDCGEVFNEFDNYDELENKTPTLISYQEFCDLLSKRIDNEMVVNLYEEQAKHKNKIYLEQVDKIVKAYQEATNMVLEGLDSVKKDELPS